TTRLDALGFGVDPTSEANDEFPAGTVFEQDPGPDTEAEEGSTIKLKVSAGAEAKPVPDVVGRDIEEARDIIEEADFVVRETPVADDEAPEGQVLAQSPDGGEEAEAGSIVELEISSGPGETEVPDVSGMTVAAASNRLGQDDFQVAQSSEASA